MGGCWSKRTDGSEYDIRKRDDIRPRTGVGLGVSMMLQNASSLMGGSTMLDPDTTNLMKQVRKAKAEGRTVTIMNGCLYFDYHFIARVPPFVYLGV